MRSNPPSADTGHSEIEESSSETTDDPGSSSGGPWADREHQTRALSPLPCFPRSSGKRTKDSAQHGTPCAGELGRCLLPGHRAGDQHPTQLSRAIRSPLCKDLVPKVRGTFRCSESASQRALFTSTGPAGIVQADRAARAGIQLTRVATISAGCRSTQSTRLATWRGDKTMERRLTHPVTLCQRRTCSSSAL